MKKYGLIGYPLSHSFSPGYFAEKFSSQGLTDVCYDLYPLASIQEFEYLKKQSLSGLNVTLPYKESVIPFLDELSDEAAEIGAVNTINFDKGKLKGYNSDVYGFQHSLEAFWQEGRKPTRALVLGTGGAAKAVWYVLHRLGIEYLKVSRTAGDLTYTDITSDIVSMHHLIVNTTPLGMVPNTKTCPDLPYENLTASHILFDLVYNPLKTLFLEKGEAKGANIQSGLKMLQLQADKAWEIWNT